MTTMAEALYYVAVGGIILAMMGLFIRFDLVGLSRQVIGLSRQANKVLTNQQLTDLDKETLMQQNAKTMLGLALRMLLLGGLAVVLPLIPFYLASLMGWLDGEYLLTLLVSWQAIVAALVVGSVIYFLAQRQP